MRNQNRIPKVIAALTMVWLRDPDLRFGQLLINAGLAKDSNEHWHMEEDEVIKRLEIFARKMEGDK